MKEKLIKINLYYELNSVETDWELIKNKVIKFQKNNLISTNNTANKKWMTAEIFGSYELKKITQTKKYKHVENSKKSYYSRWRKNAKNRTAPRKIHLPPTQEKLKKQRDAIRNNEMEFSEKPTMRKFQKFKNL